MERESFRIYILYHKFCIVCLSMFLEIKARKKRKEQRILKKVLSLNFV